MGSDSFVRVHACRLIITLSICVIVQCPISSKREASKNPACPVEAIIIITTLFGKQATWLKPCIESHDSPC